jgi:signal transduction histidine kinase
LRPHFYQTGWFYGAIGLALLSGTAVAVRRIATRKLRRELALAEQRHAIELDRARIAKDIHDDLGAGLTEISLLSELAQRDTSEDAPGYLGQISTAARGLVRAMDETVWAVNPENDTLEGLITYASKLAQDYLGVAGIRCRLDVPTRLPHVVIEADARHHLYLAIKESLNNIVKHSQASEAALRLRLETGRFTITIEDNGQGWDIAASGVVEATEEGRMHSGHGLQNLERRLKESGGRCVIRSEPGRGSRIELIMKAPIHSPELASDATEAKA